MAGLTALFVVIGNALGGQTGMFIAFGLAIAMNFFSYWFSAKIVLKMYGANEVTEREAPELHSMVRNLATRAGLPRMRFSSNSASRAKATGRSSRSRARCCGSPTAAP